MDYIKATLDKKLTGRKIGNLITTSQVTFEEVAAILGLTTPRVIYEWISGRKLPSIENLANLARMFNVKIEDVIVLRRRFLLNRWYIVVHDARLYNCPKGSLGLQVILQNVPYLT